MAITKHIRHTSQQFHKTLLYGKKERLAFHDFQHHLGLPTAKLNFESDPTSFFFKKLIAPYICFMLHLLLR